MKSFRSVIMTAIVALIGFSTVQVANAADGSSGCGPGWYLFKENSLVSSSFRSTTNASLWPAVSIGMTFGTSNCTQHKIVKTEKESLHFVTMNYFELKSDIAKGHGQYLSALAKTIGCRQDAQTQFNQELKKNYSQVFETKSIQPEAVLSEVYKTIFRNEKLTSQCSLNNVG